MKYPMKPRMHFSLASLAMIAAAHAAVIHVDINGAQTAGTAGNFNGTPATVLGGAGDTWNYVSPGSKTAGNLNALLDAAGNATTVNISWTANHWSYDSSQAIGDYRDLLGDYAYVYSGSGGQASSTWTFSGLTANATYDLVLYAAAGSNGATWTVGGVAKTADNAAVGGTLDDGVEYVRYNNAMADGSGNIAILFQPGPGSQFGEMAGMEIIPEPSAALLGGLGLLGLLRLRRA